MYEFLTYTVGDAMTKDPIVIAPGALMAEAGAIFDSHQFNGLPVVDEGKLVGVLTKLDFLKAFAFTSQSVLPHYDEVLRLPVERFMTRDPVGVDPDTPLTRVLQKMIQTRWKSVPVVRDGRLLGVIAREDILHALRAAASGRRADTASG